MTNCKSFKKPGRLWIASTLLLLTAGCANTDDVSRRIPSGGNDCFPAMSIYDWRAITDQSIVVWSPSKRCPNLVEFPMRCTGIRFTDQIAFDDRDGRICPFGGDAVIIPGPNGARCSIASIRRMTPDELADYLGDDALPEETDASAACGPPLDESSQ